MNKRPARTSILTLIFMLSATATYFAAPQQDELWTEINDSQLRRLPTEKTRTPRNYRTLRLDKSALSEKLNSAPQEFRVAQAERIIVLPMPDGSLAKFSYEHSPIVEPGLLAKYPELGETYVARGIDDPTATARFDFLPSGFHAIILSKDGTVLIDPYAKGDTENYVTYLKNDLEKTDDFRCEVGVNDLDSLLNADLLEAQRFFAIDAPSVASGTQLRTYRLALAATNEYAVRVGGNTVAGTLAAQVLIMNRVNGVFEKDLSIRMVMIANNDLIVYAGDNMNCPVATACTADNDPYTNSSGSAMLTQNTTTLTTVILPTNYDIGHVFSTGGGGVATPNGPCGANKARGVTGLGNPVGDAFAIDYVAHEMGHQWGANHTYNSGGGCSGQRSAGSAYEPGSGVTVMAYAGICGSQNLARNSIDTFHVKSLEVIAAYSQFGNGNTCAQITETGNTPPEVSIVGGTIFDIPKQTPFTLTAAGTDANGDAITYDWQQYDLGTSTTAVPNTDSDGTARPIFRPYLPTSSPSRTFPSMQFILGNASVPPSQYDCLGSACMTGELMPQIGRAMTFQVVARDNRSNGGGINTATVIVAVDGNSGPFALTSHNAAASLLGGSTQAVTWSVNGTSNSPVNAANVRISYSTDGGLTFPIILAENTPNDGGENITLPNVTTTTARIKIEAVGKIFFDISDVDLSVTASTLVDVAGRVFTPTGIPLRNVRVSLIDGAGNRRFATSASAGTYVFDVVPGNTAYTLTVASKRYRFAPKTLNLAASNAANVDFTGLE